MKYVALLPLLLFLTPEAVASPNFTMIVNSSIDRKAGDAELTFNLTFSGSRPVVVNRSSMPDLQSNAIWTSAEYFPNYGDSYQPCPRPKEKIEINDGLLGTTTIKPGQSVQQKIKLSDLYFNTNEIVGKCDLVIFWSYKPEFESGEHTERLAGAVVIPAK